MFYFTLPFLNCSFYQNRLFACSMLHFTLPFLIAFHLFLFACFTFYFTRPFFNCYLSISICLLYVLFYLTIFRRPFIYVLFVCFMFYLIPPSPIDCCVFMFTCVCFVFFILLHHFCTDVYLYLLALCFILLHHVYDVFLSTYLLLAVCVILFYH